MIWHYEYIAKTKLHLFAFTLCWIVGMRKVALRFLDATHYKIRTDPGTEQMIKFGRAVKE